MGKPFDEYLAEAHDKLLKMPQQDRVQAFGVMQMIVDLVNANPEIGKPALLMALIETKAWECQS